MVAISSYEVERAAKIARNKAMLASLGIEKPQPANGSTSDSDRRKEWTEPGSTSPRMARKTAERRRSTAKVASNSPLRRSSRVEKIIQLISQDKSTQVRNYQDQQEFLRMRQMLSSGPNARTDTTFSNDAKNKCIMNESGVDAPKRHVHEYDITLERSPHGYCIYLGIVKYSVCVVTFRRPAPHFIGPAEASGRIKPGDKLVSINGVTLYGGDDFKKHWANFSTASAITLGFRRLLAEV
ncbi:hypothetical protein H257_00922 [Aphanomyces astaci]|uniref:PDZ domain-containing protein n=1 Tax=Aphanomyces astaci TaxID=112090 RepID=W4H5K9_APHAT|nr:hypothetical protein H257_00922 [Aphanomyces astaci]ETV87295.1 hypothetical protein H257_00922 [Aphanomyces astaci]|eukprot:XP_009822158.1 hypothetical protein H257_00922 [Aphanomyces astaci]